MPAPIYTDITDTYGRQVVQTITGDQARYSVQEGGEERFSVTVPADRPLVLVLQTINAMATQA